MNAAKFFGVEFKGRNNSDNTVQISFKGEIKVYQLLQVIEFDSSRKRMTSIFKKPNGEILVLIKGADSVIFPLCHND